jgi:hypothetical protein
LIIVPFLPESGEKPVSSGGSFLPVAGGVGCGESPHDRQTANTIMNRGRMNALTG